jgi:hypothetical protein
LPALLVLFKPFNPLRLPSSQALAPCLLLAPLFLAWLLVLLALADLQALPLPKEPVPLKLPVVQLAFIVQPHSNLASWSSHSIPAPQSPVAWHSLLV